MYEFKSRHQHKITQSGRDILSFALFLYMLFFFPDFNVWTSIFENREIEKENGAKQKKGLFCAVDRELIGRDYS